MVLPNEPLPWQVDSQNSFVPVNLNGQVVGFLKPEYASHAIDLLNDEQKLRKALNLACADIFRRSKGKLGTVEMLEEEYLSQASVPRKGTRAIALLLQNRQAELGVTEKEFVQFCDSYRLSPNKLQNIYDNNLEIDSTLYAPLSRILGQSIEDVIQIVQG